MAVSGFNSIAIQVVLIAMAILSSVFIVGNYPVPRPPDPELLPMHTIVIQTWDVEKNLGEPRVTTPATGIDVQFFFWGDTGPTDELAVTSASNASGLIEVIVEEGTYELHISDWTIETIDVYENFTLVAHRFDIEELPDSINIRALSKDWNVKTNDIISIGYQNQREFETNIFRISFSDFELLSLRCFGPGGVAIEYEDGGEYGSAANTCQTGGPVSAFETWSDDFRVPAGVSIPWSVAKSNYDISLRIFYVEVTVDE